MSCLPAFLPDARLREVDRVVVRASPDEAYRAFRTFDAATIPWVHGLFAVRVLPDRLRGREADVATLGIDSIVGGKSSFRLLEDTPGRGVVVGAIGKFWRTDIEFARVDRAAFASFAEPGWGKVAWEIRAEPTDGGSVVTIELRVGATDDASWRRFVRYFALIGRFSHAIRRAVLRHLEATLGAAPVPRGDRELPGDDVVADAHVELTHAIEIDAPAAAVWPYLLQMGRGRAGWYSWDALDNGGAPSAPVVVPALQDVEVGDVLPTGDDPREGYAVLALDAPRALVLGVRMDRARKTSVAAGAPDPTKLLHVSWAFVLDELGADACRLTTRVRGRATPRAFEVVMGRIVNPVLHAIMEKKQLRGLRARAERDVLARPAP